MYYIFTLPRKTSLLTQLSLIQVFKVIFWIISIIQNNNYVSEKVNETHQCQLFPPLKQVMSGPLSTGNKCFVSIFISDNQKLEKRTMEWKNIRQVYISDQFPQKRLIGIIGYNYRPVDKLD